MCQFIRSSAAAALVGAAFLLLAAPVNAATPSNYDLSRADVTNRVLLAVTEEYYDPARIDPQVMLDKALDTLQRVVAELRVDWDEKTGKATVSLPEESLTIDISSVRSPWALSRKLRDVYRLLGKHLSRDTYDFAELEYAAVNGMLSTLDPHTIALKPEHWDDLRTSTMGEFGGLGIKITTDRRPPCRGQLTVVEVFDNTPAAGANLKPGDQILRIDGESTVNITTSEAASRLRGKPGTPVKLEVRRGESVKSHEVVRQTIPIESVKFKMLEGEVGYILLDAFQKNSFREVQSALVKLHGQGMKSLVLDMRGNPGGLLYIVQQIADMFLDSGTIVVTAGRRQDDRQVENAQVGGTEPLYPIVLLVDSRSASAAEILAGSLRNHGRVLIVGETTFGKGSVQSLDPLRDGGALKLTTAQYLLPGDISIQATGVPADVTFSPRVVDRKDMNLEPDNGRFSEADLTAHLDRPTARRREVRDVLTEVLLVPPAEHAADMARFEKCFTADDERGAYRQRHELEFARLLAAQASGVTAEELRVGAKELVDEHNKGQSEAIEKALRSMKIDWSAPSQEGEAASQVDTAITASATTRGVPVAGKELAFDVAVRNGAKTTTYRLFGVTKSDNPLFDGLELVLGKVAPGKKVKATAYVNIPALPAERVDPVTVQFSSKSGPVPAPVSVDVSVPALPRARLAYSWHVQELGEANGSFEPGEELSIFMTVRNIGQGPTVDAHVNLSAKPGIDVIQGVIPLGKLLPDHAISGQFRIRVAPGLRETSAQLELSVVEWLAGRFPTEIPLLTRRVDLPISVAVPSPTRAQGMVTIVGQAAAPLREAPTATAAMVGHAKPGSSYAVLSAHGDFLRVRLVDTRAAYVARNQTAPATTAKPAFDQALTEPPAVRIDGPLVRRVKGETTRLSGVARHPSAVRDIIVFVGEKKVLYKRNDGTSGQDSLAFDINVPLEPGANRVMVIARHDKDVAESAAVFVRRDDVPEKSK